MAAPSPWGQEVAAVMVEHVSLRACTLRRSGHGVISMGSAAAGSDSQQHPKMGQGAEPFLLVWKRKPSLGAGGAVRGEPARKRQSRS